MKRPISPISKAEEPPRLHLKGWWHLLLLLAAPVTIYLTVNLTFSQWQLNTWYPLDLRSQNVVENVAGPITASYKPLDPSLLDDLAAESTLIVMAPKSNVVSHLGNQTVNERVEGSPVTPISELTDSFTPTPTATRTQKPAAMPPQATPTTLSASPTASPQPPTATPSPTQEVLPTLPLPTMTVTLPTALPPTRPAPTLPPPPPAPTLPPPPLATIPPLPTAIPLPTELPPLPPVPTLPPPPTAAISLPPTTVPLPTAVLP